MPQSNLFTSSLPRAPEGDPMVHLLCHACGVQQHFLNISHAARIIGVSRATVHNWINRGLVHVSMLPSGRRVVCRESLTRRDTTPGLPISTAKRNHAA